MKRVAISGDEKSGKTELFNHLREEYYGSPGLWFIEDAIKDTFLNYSTDQSGCTLSEYRLCKLALGKIKAQDQQIPTNTTLAITDNGLVDLWRLNVKLNCEFNNSRLTPFLKSMKYDGALIVGQCMDEEPTDDITEIMGKYNELGVPYKLLQTPDLAERTNEASKFIGSLLI